MTLPNARLKIYVNGGDVTITLRPGQSISHHTSEPTDEGYAWEGTTWTYDADDGVVTREWGHGGRDCDGETSTSGTDYCPVDKLQAKVNQTYVGRKLVTEGDESWYESDIQDDPGWPDWQEEQPARHYDQYAELSNY
jgi:hypothetical protein